MLWAWASVSSSDAAGMVTHCLLPCLAPKEVETKKEERRTFFGPLAFVLLFLLFVVFGRLSQDIVCGKFFAKMVTIIPPVRVHIALCNMTLPILPSIDGDYFPTP